jgi:hypothetical protein
VFCVASPARALIVTTRFGVLAVDAGGLDAEVNLLLILDAGDSALISHTSQARSNGIGGPMRWTHMCIGGHVNRVGSQVLLGCHGGLGWDEIV